MVKVQTSADFRAAVHNGFWFFKIIAIIGIIVGSFFIRDPQFLYVWRIFGLIGALLFTFLQLILLVDFAHSWSEKWLLGYEETRNRAYNCGFISFTVIFYAVTIAAITCFYVYFASGPTCHYGKMLVSINLFLCVIFSIISILPSVQEKLRFSGLLQSSCISAYIMYLTWSALVNIPDVKCNPTLRTINTTTTDENGKTIEVVTADLNFNWQTGVSLTILLCSVVYACIRTSSHTSVGRLMMTVISNHKSLPPKKLHDTTYSLKRNAEILFYVNLDVTLTWKPIRRSVTHTQAVGMYPEVALKKNLYSTTRPVAQD
ncbi:hypothetical protein ACTXT7_016791 [Hymenolepis weldensis]